MPRIVTCKECGEERPHNAHGLCNRCYYHIYRPPRNREKARSNDRAYRARNREAVSARMRDYYARNRKAIGARMKDYHARNREAINARTRDYHARNREATVAKMRARSRLKGTMPIAKQVGNLNPGWQGGRIVFCSICGAYAGWRAPSKFTKNKTGFRCTKHQHVRLEHKEVNDEHSTSSPVRSSVA